MRVEVLPEFRFQDVVSQKSPISPRRVSQDLDRLLGLLWSRRQLPCTLDMGFVLGSSPARTRILRCQSSSGWALVQGIGFCFDRLMCERVALLLTGTWRNSAT